MSARPAQEGEPVRPRSQCPAPWTAVMMLITALALPAAADAQSGVTIMPNGSVSRNVDNGNGTTTTIDQNGSIARTHNDGNGSSTTVGPNSAVTQTLNNANGTSRTVEPPGSVTHSFGR